MNNLTLSAMAILKKAYDECGDVAVRESIYSAAKAIAQLHQDLETYPGRECVQEGDSEYDPSEYCAAV
jgi:hypothetical protein